MYRGVVVVFTDRARGVYGGVVVVFTDRARGVYRGVVVVFTDRAGGVYIGVVVVFTDRAGGVYRGVVVVFTDRAGGVYGGVVRDGGTALPADPAQSDHPDGPHRAAQAPRVCGGHCQGAHTPRHVALPPQEEETVHG